MHLLGQQGVTFAGDLTLMVMDSYLKIISRLQFSFIIIVLH